MIQVEVKIMGQNYRLVCESGKEEQLKEAVKYLDEKMCKIRDEGKIKGGERIAILAAIEMAVEKLEAKLPGGPFSDMTVSEVNNKVKEAHIILDKALLPQGELF